MSKQLPQDEKLENAMAEALAAVERAEKRSNTVMEPPEEIAEVTDIVEVENKEGEVVPDEGASAEPDKSAKLSAEFESLKEQHLRLAADFENFRKRAARQIQDAKQFGIEHLLADLLPVLDNMERALSHGVGEENPWLVGIRMVAKQFLDVLGNHGVEGFSSIGKPFDPERHEAVGKKPSKEHAPGTVVEETLKGYFLRGRLIRPAQVLVACETEPSKLQDNTSSSESSDN